MIHRLRGAGLAVVVAAVVFAATGCLVASADIDVEEDGSGTLTIQVVPEDTWLKRGGDAIYNGLVQALEARPDLDVEEVSEATGRGIRVTLPFEDVGELTTPVPTGIPGVVFNPIRRFDVVRAEDGWVLSGEAATVGDLLAGLPDVPVEADVVLEYELSVDLPGGRVVSTNAQTSEGTRATWTIGGDNGGFGTVDLRMRTGPGAPVNRFALVAAAALGVVVVGAALVMLSQDRGVRRKLRKQDEPVPERSWAQTAAPTPTASAAAAPTEPSEPSEGMYSEHTGDRSTALPVGGAAWGPAPPPPGSGGSTGLADLPGSVAAPAVPAGWYADPSDPERLRWWDGERWTDHRS